MEIIESCKGGDSVLTLYLGTSLAKENIEQTLGAHGFYTPCLRGLSSLSDWREIADQDKHLLNWITQFFQLTTYEISCPVIRDSSLAPDGKVGLIISTLMDYELVDHLYKNGKYEEFKELASITISKILNDTIFSGLIENTLFRICSTPLTLARRTGNFQGAITGWEFSNRVPAKNRFNKMLKSVNTPIEDILQCGQWTFSPSGLPVCVISGKVAADKIRKSIKTKQR